MCHCLFNIQNVKLTDVRFGFEALTFAQDCHTNVLRRMQKIKERKQELIKRLKLHEAASNLGLSLRAAKTGALTKRKTTTGERLVY